MKGPNYSTYRICILFVSPIFSPTILQFLQIFTHLSKIQDFFQAFKDRFVLQRALSYCALVSLSRLPQLSDCPSVRQKLFSAASFFSSFSISLIYIWICDHGGQGWNNILSQQGRYYSLRILDFSSKCRTQSVARCFSEHNCSLKCQF